MEDTVNSGSNGITELLEQKDEENAKLRVRVAELEDMIMKLSEDVRSLTAESELAVSRFHRRHNVRRDTRPQNQTFVV